MHGTASYKAEKNIISGKKMQDTALSGRENVTQYWKTSLIAAILILRYGSVKSPQVYLAKNDFLL